MQRINFSSSNYLALRNGNNRIFTISHSIINFYSNSPSKFLSTTANANIKEEEEEVNENNKIGSEYNAMVFKGRKVIHTIYYFPFLLHN